MASSPAPALRPAPAPSIADLQREYVAGGIYQRYNRGPRALPFAIDEVTAQFGADVYERMLAHPQVAAVVRFFVSSIIEDGMSLDPAIDDKNDPNFALAQEIHVEAQRMLDGLQTPLDDVLNDQLSAIWQGNSVAELTYRPVKAVQSDRLLLNIASIKVKPLWSYAFVCDPYFNVLGILPQQPGSGNPAYAGASLTDEQLAQVLPREKFIILSHRPRNADPRGTSCLRPAFVPWNRSQAISPEYLAFLTLFSSPWVFGFTAPAAEPVYQRDANGAYVLDPVTGQPVVISAEQQMLDRLLAMKNNSAASFPHGASVQVEGAQGTGEAFLRAFARDDQQITKAVLTASLTTEEGEHQTRAATTVHQDATDTLVRQEKRWVQGAYHRDALEQWVRLNWGEAAVALTPRPNLGTVEQQDRAAMVASVARAGYKFDQRSQLAEVDSILGFTPRDLDRPPDLVPATPPAFGGASGAPPDSQQGPAVPAEQGQAAA